MLYSFSRTSLLRMAGREAAEPPRPPYTSPFFFLHTYPMHIPQLRSPLSAKPALWHVCASRLLPPKKEHTHTHSLPILGPCLKQSLAGGRPHPWFNDAMTNIPRADSRRHREFGTSALLWASKKKCIRSASKAVKAGGTKHMLFLHTVRMFAVD